MSSKEKANANLSLGLIEAPDVKRSTGLEASIERFQQWLAMPDSPVRCVRREPARPGEYAAIPDDVHPQLKNVLAARGIERLYSHQAESFAASAQEKNVVVVTPTASGKTLCYNLPVLNRILADPTARALYLFPTKALAMDQLHELQTAANLSGDSLRAFTYDGDTPQDARKAIRERANLVLTNPDMLHSGILPHHTKWAKCFENLKFIVIDELHTYRGVYGSHLANVLRRLRRICAFYGSNPQFICSSATIANPKELAEALTEQPFELVDRNGAPRGEKYFVLYNPPFVNRQLGIRRSYLHETRRIATELIERGQQTLVFANNRLATEVLLTYLRDACEHGPVPGGTVRGYRGGYLPRERREIERELRNGDVRAVIATNALELGIDIGSLDAVVMAGYPGSIASTWQRAGRAGRRVNSALAVLVTSSAPVDQYIAEHPEYLFERSPEQGHIHADNLEILLNHLKCAAFELPLQEREKFGPHDLGELCRFLAESGVLHNSAGNWHWTGDTYPADAVSLRSVTSDNFVVVDVTRDHEIIAEVAFSAALTTLHEKAIYLHEARQYQVERFDYEGRKAYVRHVDSDYFTDAIDYTQVKELESFDKAPIAECYAAHGDVRVSTQVVGFKKVKFYTLENIGSGRLSLPEQEMQTTSLWIEFPEAFLQRFADLSRNDQQNAILGIGNLLRTAAAILLMCDPRDLGLALGADLFASSGKFEPALFLYDNYPGGIGQSGPLFKQHRRLLAGALDALRGCECEHGCPACVGPPAEIGDNGKPGALRMLAALNNTPELKSQAAARMNS